MKQTNNGEMNDVLCFHAQQLVEKSLKGAISCIPHQPDASRIHSTGQLLMLCEQEIKESTQAQTAAFFVDDYYVPTRYFDSFDFPMVTRQQFSSEEAEEATVVALEVANICLDYMERKCASM